MTIFHFDFQNSRSTAHPPSCKHTSPITNPPSAKSSEMHTKDRQTQNASISSRGSGELAALVLIPILLPTPVCRTTCTVVPTPPPRLRTYTRARPPKLHYLDQIPTKTSIATQERDPHTSTRDGKHPRQRNLGSKPSSLTLTQLKPTRKKNSISPFSLGALHDNHSPPTPIIFRGWRF